MKSLFVVLLTFSSVVGAANDVGIVATVEVTSGPHAGKHSFQSPDACIIAGIDKSKPAGFAVMLLSETSRLTIDIPSIDPAQINELQAELVFADVKPGQSRKNTATTTYSVDTRPDSTLARYQREERAGKGTSGKATAVLNETGAIAKLQLTAETAAGQKLQGTIECRKIDRELGR
jgi:hypothetical protein